MTIGSLMYDWGSGRILVFLGLGCEGTLTANHLREQI